MIGLTEYGGFVSSARQGVHSPRTLELGKEESRKNCKSALYTEEKSQKIQSLKRTTYVSSDTISAAFPRKHVRVLRHFFLQYGRLILCRLFLLTHLTEEAVGGTDLSWGSDFRVLTW